MNLVALAGGVGGARLADGLARCLPPGSLSVIVNTGDDFTRYGLAISPDLDTVMYNLAGLAHPINGWGLVDDSQQMIEMMRRYGDEAWFGLGDRDLATHLLRTQALHSGKLLSEVTAQLTEALGIKSKILPMSDNRVATMVETVDRGLLEFQEYFVRYRWQPVVKAICYDGAELAMPAPGVIEALEQADGIIFCPSNPVLSVEPILQVQGIRDTILNRNVPCVAVSPLIGGKAVKGPAAKLMDELSLDASSRGIATYYGTLIDGLMIDTSDSDLASAIPQKTLATNILMPTVEERVRLAHELLDWVGKL